MSSNGAIYRPSGDSMTRVWKGESIAHALESGNGACMDVPREMKDATNANTPI